MQLLNGSQRCKASPVRPPCVLTCWTHSKSWKDERTNSNPQASGFQLLHFSAPTKNNFQKIPPGQWHKARNHGGTFSLQDFAQKQWQKNAWLIKGDRINDFMDVRLETSPIVFRRGLHRTTTSWKRNNLHLVLKRHMNHIIFKILTETCWELYFDNSNPFQSKENCLVVDLFRSRRRRSLAEL